MIECLISFYIIIYISKRTVKSHLKISKLSEKNVTVKCLSHIAFSRSQLYYKLYVVGLYLCVVGGAAAAYLAALGTTVYYNISLFGIGLGADGLKQAATLVCAVTGVYVNVY